MGKTVRLDRLLSGQGYGTRKEIKELVRAGKVLVNGETAKDAACHVDPETSTIEVDGERLIYRKFLYVMMNKPAGVVSATWDSRLRTVIDILPEEYRVFEPFPVGRLDRDTEGLLLLTNDGQLAHALTSPRRHIPKKYFAIVRGRVTEEDISAFQMGVILDDGYETLPAGLKILKYGEISETIVTVEEGKFHQVKRMFRAVGKEVIYLKRIEMGTLVLDPDLKPGECRELSEDEVKKLRQIAKTEVD